MNWRGLFRLIKLVLIAGAVCGLSYMAVFRTDWFILRSFEIDANEDRKPWIEDNFNKYYAAHNTFLVSMEEGADLLRSDPSVKRAKIKRKLPSGLVYVIEYRKAMAAFAFEGLYLRVDPEGYLVSSVQERPADIPVVEGLRMDAFVVGKPIATGQTKQMKVVLDLVTLLGKAGLEKGCAVTMDAQTVTVKLKSGISGRFWYRTSAEESFNRFMSVYNDQVKKGVSSGLIDVSSEGYPVYKPFGE